MKRKALLFLIMIILGMGMIIRTFFGGNGDSPKVQSEGTGFVEIINETGNIQNTINTGEIEMEPTQTDIQVNTGDVTLKEYNEIRMIMPKYFYNSNWNEFAKDIYNEKNVLISFTFTDNLNSYRDLLSDSEFSGADLFLFPYDWKDTVKALEFSPMNGIEGLFDDFILPLIKKNEIGLLPFAADPMIMYSAVNLPYNNFSEISNLAYLRESNIQLAFPIFFGITSEDYTNKGFSREYQDIVRYALLHYFKKYKDSHYLGMRINSNISNSDEFKNYNVGNLNKIANTITKAECKDFPSICFQLYNFVGIRFGFLSDKDIVHNYFSRKDSTFENLSKYPMPFYSIESPVRVWGFGISKNINSIDTANAINKILVYYIENHNKYNLWNSTLSVFNEEGKVSLTDEPYIGSKGYILDEGGNFINTLRGSNPFRQLLDSQISASSFLKK